jgi:cellulose synthase (UDP-forming)
MGFYFDRYESRQPPQAVPYSAARELLWQFFATVNLVLGAWYITWRWTSSLNHDALWFAIPLVLAETLAYIGLVLFTINLWAVRDTERAPPPRLLCECVRDPHEADRRPLRIDVFFPTYSEEPELVQLSIRDAKRIRYPHPIDVRIHVLDDGKREEMRQVALEEGVSYITRDSNVGFKAGNLRNAMEQTDGDFLLICDADTRPFPTILEHTLGYFRDPDVAWVQTPQWFFDLPEGTPLHELLARRIGRPGRWLGRLAERLFGPIRVGEDLFCNDPTLFYDVIQRRRNWANASFCCGAGSIHRREAVMEAALKTYADAIDGLVRRTTGDVKDEEIRGDLTEAMRRELVLETELTPYKFHVSEDIYTSIVLHADRDRNWKSVYHPQVESKMLSPQDLLSWMVQRFKYAGGTFDIVIHDNPLFRKGLRLPQKLMYGVTFWSYFAALWTIVFLAAPIVYLFTGVAPVAAYDDEFFKHIIPFLLCNELAFMIGTWGVRGWEGRVSYQYSFPLVLRALWTVVKGEKIKFPVTPKTRQEGNFARLVLPQIAVMVLTAAGILFATARWALGHPVHFPALVANALWGLNNIWTMSRIVRAAFWKPEE